jgi:G:T-mismatch repair DNA endonuclease (very short patch repair protein)
MTAKGGKQSPEHVAKRVAKQFGQKRTEETKARISAKKKGVPQSESAKQKHRESYQYDRINSPEAVAKRDAKRRGAKRSEEAKAKMSESAKRRFARMNEAERVAYLTPWIDGGQKAADRVFKDTHIEKLVEETLKASGVTYEKQYKVGYYRCDFYVPATNTIIEVNGCFVHQCPTCGYNNRRTEEIRAKDARKLAYLQSKGYTVNIIWEHAIDGHKARKPKGK